MDLGLLGLDLSSRDAIFTPAIYAAAIFATDAPATGYKPGWRGRCSRLSGQLFEVLPLLPPLLCISAYSAAGAKWLRISIRW